MVTFKELGISNDSKALVIDACIPDLPWFEDCYIESVKVCGQDAYMDGSEPPSGALSLYERPGGTPEGCHKEVSLVVQDGYQCGESVFHLPLDDTLFFVYVKMGGTPKPYGDEPVPCGFDEEWSMGVTFSTCKLYEGMMQHVKETADTCQVPANFLDWYMRVEALEAAINCNHLMEAVSIWNKWFKGNGPMPGSYRNYLCHG